MQNSEPRLDERAADLLAILDERGLSLAVAESCTGGLLAAYLTDVEGLSHVFERGFIVYCDEAKADMLGVDRAVLADAGAVSGQCAEAMVRGALHRSRADVAVAITGYAGPTDDGGEEGLVYIAASMRDAQVTSEECHFGKVGRDTVRVQAARASIALIERCLDQHGRAEAPVRP